MSCMQLCWGSHCLIRLIWHLSNTYISTKNLKYDTYLHIIEISVRRLNWWGNNAMMQNINGFSGHNFLGHYAVIYLMLYISGNLKSLSFAPHPKDIWSPPHSDNPFQNLWFPRQWHFWLQSSGLWDHIESEMVRNNSHKPITSIQKTAYKSQLH